VEMIVRKLIESDFGVNNY